MTKNIFGAKRSGKSKKKGRAAAKSPKTAKTGKASANPATTSKQQKKRSKTLKAIAASKSRGGGVEAQPSNAVVVEGSFGSPTEVVAEVAKVGKALKVIKAQYRESLYAGLARLYACACYLREDDDARVLFCQDPYWNDVTVKPRRDKQDDVLRFVVRRALVGERKQVNDRVHKYTRALLPSWEARRTPDEVLELLKELGITQAAKGLPMKEIAQEPEVDASDEGDEDDDSDVQEDDDDSVAQEDDALEGEVLADQEELVKRQVFHIDKTGSRTAREAVWEEWRDKDGLTRLSVNIRPLK